LDFDLGQICWAFIYSSDIFHAKKLKNITINPMIVSKKVGVKFPVIGTGAAEAVAVDLGVAVAFGEDDGDALGLRDFEGVASKAGNSLA